jgi:cytochrome P450
MTTSAKQANRHHDVEVKTSTGTYYIPTNTIIYVSTVAIHLDPATWGKDSHAFKPSRWLVKPALAPSAVDPQYTIANNIKSFPKGTFLPWSSGPRACPGQKMSQVEFVSVFMTIFGQYRCEAVKVKEGETPEEVKRRIEAITRNSAPKLTLQMSRNRDLKVRWIKR